MKQYIAVKPVELKGIRRRIGEQIPGTDIHPEGLGWLIRMGYLAEVAEESGGPADFGVSLLPVETDVDGLGKTAGEMGTLALAEDGSGFTGTLNYITGYTGFNSADPDEQEGYFLPFGFTLPDGYSKAHMMVKGGSGKSAEPTAQNVIFLGKTAEGVKARSLVITLNQVDSGNPDNINSVVKEYSLEGLTAASQSKSRKKG